MGWPNVLLLVAAIAGQTAQLPPPFPRPGTTLLLDNDVVAVWNVSWLKQQYPLHTHRYGLVGISYVEGDRIITQGRSLGQLVQAADQSGGQLFVQLCSRGGAKVFAHLGRHRRPEGLGEHIGR